MSEISGGSCECGAFRYAVEGEPRTVVVCHCSHCQHQSGSAFGMSMVIAAGQFRVLSGVLQHFSRPADSGATMNCYFCPQCGTRIYHQKEGNDATIILKPGTLDSTAAISPARQLWTSAKQHWISLPDMPAFERQPG